MILSKNNHENNLIIVLIIQASFLILLQVDEILASDSPAIWMTTFQMLEQLSIRRSILANVLENISELSSEQRLQLLLCDEDWSAIDDILAALGPFKVNSCKSFAVKSENLSISKLFFLSGCCSHPE